jgi:hypothetical protein
LSSFMWSPIASSLMSLIKFNIYRYRVQASGACTKLSQNSRFVSHHNMHTERDRERQRPSRNTKWELSNIPLKQIRTCRVLNSVLLCTVINWFSAISVGWSGLLSLLVKLWCFSCWWMIST